MNGMPRFQEQSTRPQGTAVYDLNIIKITFVVVFHTVLRKKRGLVTCEDGCFVFFCSASQCSGCWTDINYTDGDYSVGYEMFVITTAVFIS